MKVTFIGGGNMATALIGGRINAGAAASDFSVVDPVDAQRDALVEAIRGHCVLRIADRRSRCRSERRQCSR